MSLETADAPDFTLDSTGGEPVTLSETLDSGPTVVLINRGHWCSFCAEQLQTFSEVSYDLWFNDGVDILPVVTDSQNIEADATGLDPVEEADTR